MAGPSDILSALQNANTLIAKIQQTLNSGLPALVANGIALGNLAQIAGDTILGNAAGSTGNVAALTVAQLQSMFTASSLINVQVFSANGTYTPTSGTNFVIVEVQAPGGGGGGTAGTDGAHYGLANAGGGGSYAKCFCTVAQVSGAAVTVPAGGAGGAAGANAGTGGSTASFILGGGVSISCPGGVGAAAGQLLPSSTTFTSANSTPTAPSASPTISGATATLVSQAGGASQFALSGTSSGSLAGNGGTSAMSAGAPGNNVGGAGINATGFGGGGGGASLNLSLSAVAGGNGSAGRVIVSEFR